MKTILTIAATLFGIVGPCFGAGDPVSSVTKTDREEITTFTRDGKMILKTTLYGPAEPKERQVLRQVVLFHDEPVLEAIELRDKRSLKVHAKAAISVMIEQDSSRAGLETVILTDDSNVVVEIFRLENGRLTPISGKRLDFNRDLAKDLSNLFSPENVQQTTPEKFVKQAEDLTKKYGAKEPDKENGKSGSTPQAPGDKDSSAAKPGGELVELTVRVVQYSGDRMHSSAKGKEGGIYHPDTYDASVCEILSPAAYAGQQLQIWGWNRKTRVDPELREKDNVVVLQCDIENRGNPPWKSGPTGFGQWKVKISKAPTSR
jgi:hypothetical protein